MSTEARRVLRLLDTSWPISREPSGRPYFADGHADFSLSHSRNVTATGYISRAEGSTARIGCDVQYAGLSRQHKAIREAYFRPIEKHGDSEREFYRLWTLKEAWLKLHGLPIFEIGRAPGFKTGTDCDSEDTPPDNEPVYYLYELLIPPNERYTLAAAILREGGVYMKDPIFFLCGKRSEGKHILLAGPDKLEMAQGEWGIVQGDWRNLHKNVREDIDEYEEERSEWDVDRADECMTSGDWGREPPELAVRIHECGAESLEEAPRNEETLAAREAPAEASEAAREAEYRTIEGRVVMQNRHITITRIPVAPVDPAS